MAKGLILVRAEGGRELQNLNKRMRNAGDGKELRKRLRTEIREAGEPAVRDLQAAVMRVNVTSSRGGMAKPNRSTGLRRRVAKATGISVTSAGIRIKVSPKKVSRGRSSSTGKTYGETLPKYLDATLGRYDRWRHPVFFAGSISEAPSRRVVQQRGQPWFFITLDKHRDSFRKGARAAMDDIKDLIQD